MKKIMPLVAIAVILLASTAVGQQRKFGQKPVITLAIAKQLAAAILKDACKNPPPEGTRPIVKNSVEGDCLGVVAIADDHGTVFYLETLDGTQLTSIHMAMEKAKTAAVWRRSTENMYSRAAAVPGGSHMYLDGSFNLSESPRGGEPLYVGNDCVGGIGFAGGGMEANLESAVAIEWKKIIGEK
jgi:glc operon protein GlcG